MSFSNLTALQRDLVVCIADDARSGREIQAAMQADRVGDLRDGVLYDNLSTLVGRGLVEKGQRDGRTNEYRLTDHGRDAIDEQLGWIGEQLD